MPWFIYTLLPGTVISLAAIAQFGSFVILNFVLSLILFVSASSLNLPILYIPSSILFGTAIGLIIFDLKKEKILNFKKLEITNINNFSAFLCNHALYNSFGNN